MMFVFLIFFITCSINPETAVTFTHNNYFFLHHKPPLMVAVKTVSKRGRKRMLQFVFSFIFCMLMTMYIFHGQSTCFNHRHDI